MQLYVQVASFDQAERESVLSLGAVIEVFNEELQLLQLRISYNRVTELADLPFVIKVKPPQYAMTRTGAILTEGDRILNADLARALGVDGTGVKVGVISDGANDRTLPQASGDLPQNITQFGTCQVRAPNFFNCDPDP